eukprot:gene3377-3865_t
MALVPYTANGPTGFLQTFQSTERSFNFLSRSIHIRQDWEGSGVAGVVWDAAIVLATYLQTLSLRPNDFSLENKKIIELGAGTGLVGMVSCLLGGDVVITDTSKALECTKENVNRNLLKENERTRCKVEELHWGRNLEQWKGTYWDLIIGADIVYIKDTFNELFETFKILTEKNDKAKIILSCRIRYQRDVDFFNLLKTEFTVKEIYYDTDRDVKIFESYRR